MAYLNFTTGLPIAKVMSGNLAGDTIYLFDPDFDKVHPTRGKRFNKVAMPDDDDGKIFVIPPPFPTQVYLAGPNGSGKTHTAAMYIMELLEMYPNIRIYVFSDLEEDPEIDNISERVHRIMIDYTLISEPLNPEDFANSVVLFDDIDSIADKKILQAVNTLKDSILKTSRHSNTYVLVTNHLITDRDKTRVSINECRELFLFHKSGSNIERILKVYTGLSNKQIEILKQLPGRWLCFHKNAPQYIVYEYGVMLLTALK